MGRDVRRRPNLSTRKLERIFALDSSGGTLQLDSSDVKLIVPPNAIPEDLTYTIEKKIHVTDLDEFQSHVKCWDKNEHFISPIPEYNILQMTHNGRPIAQQKRASFQEYVKIRIPHCINQEDCLQDIRVYCSDPANEEFGRPVPRVKIYSDDGVLPQGSIGSDLDCFFTVDTEYVWVYTLHFTQYICTCRRDCNLNMETLLFGCMKQFTGKQEVYLTVYLCEALFRLREYKQTIIEDEAQLADPRILISRIALTLPERLTYRDQFHIEIEPEVDPDDEGSPWKHIVATGFEATKIMNAGDVLGCYHICQEGTIPPKPKDVKFLLRKKGPRVETFSGHLHVNSAKRNGNPSYDMRNLNQLPFTVDLRHAPTQTDVVAERSQSEDAVSSVLDSSLEGAAAHSSHSSDGSQDRNTASNRSVPEGRHDRTAASSTLEETTASAWK